MIDWRAMPPLSALRAFSVFAETETLEEAGRRIGVTHAAISQQIRTLEEFLGTTLVERGGRSLGLTEDGLRLASAIGAGFGHIALTLSDLDDQSIVRPLRITSVPAFASAWLLPRLTDFRRRNPDVEISLDQSSDLRELGLETDIALRYGSGNWAGVEVRLLINTPLVVVAAPSLAPPDAHHDLSALAKFPWLQEFHTSEVADFFARHGETRRSPLGLFSLPGNLMLEAARDGQGLALIARAFVERDVTAGRLHVLFEDNADEGYFLLNRPGTLRPAVRAFCDWIMSQAHNQ